MENIKHKFTFSD